jgi:hypothetical protein
MPHTRDMNQSVNLMSALEASIRTARALHGEDVDAPIPTAGVDNEDHDYDFDAYVHNDEAQQNAADAAAYGE